MVAIVDYHSLWIERRAEFDIFYWLDRRLSAFLHLRERWIYATRPAFSIQLAVRLAEIGMAISLGKSGRSPSVRSLAGGHLCLN
jgi:hypothetical protein